MRRLLFTKTGEAVWMSHLDLMRLFQRSFKRAGLPLTHTQGYSPRPSVSIALPLSVGVESQCEILDFDLEGEMPPCPEITDRLNQALIPGLRVLETYETGRKIRDIALLRCELILEYDEGLTDNTLSQLSQLFARESLLVEKKGKNGPQQQDIIPMIRTLDLSRVDTHCARMEALICCQNPSLNPMLLITAIETWLPQCKPSFAKCKRLEIYDSQLTIFR